MSRRGRTMIDLDPKATRTLYALARTYNLSLNDLLTAIGMGARLSRRDREERAAAHTRAE